MGYGWTDILQWNCLRRLVNFGFLRLLNRFWLRWLIFFFDLLFHFEAFLFFAKRGVGLILGHLLRRKFFVLFRNVVTVVQEVSFLFDRFLEVLNILFQFLLTQFSLYLAQNFLVDIERLVIFFTRLRLKRNFSTWRISSKM